ncbi:MAG: carbonic anhydrase [Bacteriovoracaceae bacterium]|nr:carbonic anhydrase [Bacteriovoracaceae bacterium]
MNRNAEEVLKKLKRGNHFFKLGQPRNPNNDNIRRKEVLDNGQNPFVTILTCSDSRVPPELIFDRGIGDLFVIRNAGNILDDVTIGTIEYAVEHLKTPLVVILGHQDCGAVKATIQGGDLPGHLSAITKKIMPAVEACRGEKGDLILHSIRANSYRVAHELRERSEILKNAILDGRTAIIAAYYSLETGEVEFLD